MLLKPLQGTCTYRIQGWWTYEICFGKHIRQYHEEKDQPKPTMEFFLGLHTAQSELYVTAAPFRTCAQKLTISYVDAVTLAMRADSPRRRRSPLPRPITRAAPTAI